MVLVSLENYNTMIASINHNESITRPIKVFSCCFYHYHRLSICCKWQVTRLKWAPTSFLLQILEELPVSSRGAHPSLPEKRENERRGRRNNKREKWLKEVEGRWRKLVRNGGKREGKWSRNLKEVNISDVVRKGEWKRKVSKVKTGGGGRVWRLQLICAARRIQAVKEEPSLIT